VAKIILVDDSASARKLLGLRLTEAGHEVVQMASASEAAEMALASPPNAIVTDLFMPGVSGLQLCRLLRSEPATAHVPVVLMTASDDRRSRFWARHAGATAYVTKSEFDKLIDVLRQATATAEPRGGPVSLGAPMRGTVQERLSMLLDAALFESTIAGELRALGHKADDLERMFEELASLASDVVEYRWLSLITEQSPRLLIHAHVDTKETAEREARDALAVHPPPEPERRRAAAGVQVTVLADTRASDAEWSSAPLLGSIKFGATKLGSIAIAPARRGASNDDRRFMSLLSSELGGPLQMVALVAEARRLANTDTLTGLLNRRAFVESIEKARAKNDPAVFPLSFLLLDVDHFKKVNDTRGHDAGDAVLQGVARVLTSMARKTDFVARWGGEEFVVALTQTAEAGARVAAERVRRAIADTKYPLPNGDSMNATASVGLASAHAHDWNLEELLSRADKAMYAAKNRGRNRVEVA
jgi:two-component system cell cycle response regulator